MEQNLLTRLLRKAFAGLLLVCIGVAALIVLTGLPARAATVCQIFNGCTGTSTPPAYGQLLIGGKNGEYEFVASSTLATISGVSSFNGRTGAVTPQSGDYTTSLVAEGSNLYYTAARSLADFITNLAATTSVKSIVSLPSLSLPYSQVTGTPDLSQYLTLSAWFGTTTDQLAEGASNLYFTNARARAAISLTTTGTSGAATYNSTTGILNIPQYVGTTYSAAWPITLTGSTFGFDGLATTSPWTALQLVQVASNGTVSSIATSSLNLTTSSFKSGNVSQWTNDAGYLTSLAGAASSTLLADNNTFSGSNTFASAPVLGSLTGFIKAASGVLSTAPINLAADVTGTLPVANGGTGSTTLTGILKGNGTGQVQTAIGDTDYQKPITLTTTGTSGAATFSGNVLNIPQYAGTTYTANWPITLSGSAFGFDGIGTSTNPAVGQLAYWTGLKTLGSVGTSTLTASSPLTGSFIQVGSGGSLGCQTASGSQAGCLSSADWTTFNNKVTGTSSSANGQIAIFNGTGGKTIKGANGASFSDEGYLTVNNQINIAGDWTQFQATGNADLNFKALNASRAITFSIGSTDRLTVKPNEAGFGTTTPWGALSASSTSAFPTLAVQQLSTGPAAVFLGGNLGIGTTSPGSPLSLNGIANFTNATSTFYSTGGINLAGGCFAINGSCLSGGSGSGTVGSGTTGQVPYYAADGTTLTATSSLTLNTLQQVLFKPGTATAPGLAFSDDTNTGLSNEVGGPGTIGFVVDGVEVAQLRSTTFFLGMDLNDQTSGSYHIEGTAAGTAAAPTYTFNADQNTGMYRASADILGFSTAGINRLTIDASGNVGIGTTTPQWLLNPYSATAPQLTLSSGAGTSQWAFRNANGTLYVATTTVTGTATSTVAALTIDANGKVRANCFTTDGTTCISGGTGDPFPFTATGYGVSTSTTVGFTNGLLSTASSTFTGPFRFSALSAGSLALGAGGLLYSHASTTYGDGLTWTAGDVDCDTANGSTFGCLSAADWTTFNAKQAAISATWPILLTGATVSFDGIATSSAPSIGNLAYWTGAKTLGTVATTSVSCSGSVSCTAFAAIGTSPITISGTGGFSWPFPNNATSTLLAFNGGLTAYASSTIGNGLAAGGLTVSGNATTSSLYVSGNVGIGNPAPIYALDVTGAVHSTNSFVANDSFGLVWSNTNNAIFGNSSTHEINIRTNGVQRFLINSAGNIGIGTSSPNWLLQVSGTRPSFALSDFAGGTNLKHWLFSSMGGNLYIGTSTDAFATSSLAALTLTNKGQLSTTEAKVATSTVMTIDWNGTPNQVLVNIGVSAVTIGFNNASTAGMTKRVLVCNPGGTAGALTWSVGTIIWAGGTAPTQTTTANKCDLYSFVITAGTSTTKIFGAASTGF